MEFINALSGFIGPITLVSILGLLLTLYSTMHIDTIKYTLLAYDKKAEYSFKRLIINIVFTICSIIIVLITTFIYKADPRAHKVNLKIACVGGFILLGVAFLIIFLLFPQLCQIWKQNCKFRYKIKKICVREDIIFPLIASWFFINYAFLCYIYIYEKIVDILAIILLLGIIVFIPALIYGMYKKSSNEQNISYYYAYENNTEVENNTEDENNAESHFDKIYIYENIDGVLVCRYKDCTKVTEEESDKLSKKLSECEKYIGEHVSDENIKKSITDKINEVKKYNRYGYIELGDKCVQDFVDKINGYNGVTVNNESLLKIELEKKLIIIRKFTSIKLVDISSIKNGEIYPHLDNIEKFNNLM